jgi:hypothetical protein
MSDNDDLAAWLDANAALLGIQVAPEWRDSVRLHLLITRDHAQRVMSFELPDDAEPAPVFRA